MISPAAGSSWDGARTRTVYLRTWRIDLTVRANVPRVLADVVLARTAARALEAAGAPAPASLGVILSSDEELATLNGRHMGQPGPTDVLSFPLLSPASYGAHAGKAAHAGPDKPFILPPSARVHLGDIVISVERAIGQADAGLGGQTGTVHWAPSDELRLLVTHGVLHICGWDHADPVEEHAMRALEQRLLKPDSSDGLAEPVG